MSHSQLRAQAKRAGNPSQQTGGDSADKGFIFKSPSTVITQPGWFSPRAANHAVIASQEERCKILQMRCISRPSDRHGICEPCLRQRGNHQSQGVPLNGFGLEIESSSPKESTSAIPAHYTISKDLTGFKSENERKAAMFRELGHRISRPGITTTTTTTTTAKGTVGIYESIPPSGAGELDRIFHQYATSAARRIIINNESRKHVKEEPSPRDSHRFRSQQLATTKSSSAITRKAVFPLRVWGSRDGVTQRWVTIRFEHGKIVMDM